MDIDTMRFVENIKKAVKEKGTTVNQMLISCGLNKSFVYDISNKNVMPSVEGVAKISNFLNVSVDYLLGRETPPQTDAPKPPILEKYNKLNHAGKRKAEEYISDLAGNSKYTEEYAEEISCGKKRNNVIDIMPYLIHKK